MTHHTWVEWFIHHIRQAPFQILHMRDLAENTIPAQDLTQDRIKGGKDQSPLPYRPDPADDADLLYATLIIFAQEIAEKIGGSSPQELRNHHWKGRNEPQGLPTCTKTQAFTWTANIVLWLQKCAPHIAEDPTLNDTPNDLIRVIRKMMHRYPTTQQFKAYRPQPCPICGDRSILPIWNTNGLQAMQCDNCQATWPVNPHPAGTPTQQHQNESDDPEEPSDTGNTKDSPPNSTNTAAASSKKNTSSNGGDKE